MSLIFLPALETVSLLFVCLLQSRYEGLCLHFLHTLMSCLVGIPRKPAFFFCKGNGAEVEMRERESEDWEDWEE